LLVDGLTEDHTTSGIRIKGNVTWGGPVHDLVYQNICMRGVKNPIAISPYYTNQTTEGRCRPGSARAEYGARLLQTLASSLAAEFGRGFDASNLRHMRVFYQAFPIRDALRPELSWTHYGTLLRVERDSARQWYMNEAASQGWTTRSLERQISTLYYERLLTSSDRIAVEDEAKGNLAPSQTPRDFVRDPVMLEFLGLPGVGKLLEADLERALLDNLLAFLLELGRGFAFVARQFRISTDSKDFYIDLVFYNYLLKLDRGSRFRTQSAPPHRGQSDPLRRS
jgi:predicted nuclease of restriction endonuclease-like (RecB) superfamily